MKEKTVIDALIDHSRAIGKYRAMQEHIRRYKFMLSRSPDNLPSGYALAMEITNTEANIYNRIRERNNACKVFLRKLIDTDRYHFKERFHFSISELQDGYILLHANYNEPPEKVLFLSSYKSIKKGEILYFTDCDNLLLEIQSVLKPGDLTFRFLTFNKHQI